MRIVIASAITITVWPVERAIARPATAPMVVGVMPARIAGLSPLPPATAGATSSAEGRSARASHAANALPTPHKLANVTHEIGREREGNLD